MSPALPHRMASAGRPIVTRRAAARAALLAAACSALLLLGAAQDAHARPSAAAPAAPAVASFSMDVGTSEAVVGPRPQPPGIIAVLIGL